MCVRKERVVELIKNHHMRVNKLIEERTHVITNVTGGSITWINLSSGVNFFDLLLSSLYKSSLYSFFSSHGRRWSKIVEIDEQSLLS